SYRSRLHRWLEDAQHLVGTDGSTLYQGRSLTYRFAVLAPFWVGALCDATPLPAGRTRRLASGVLRHFAERGAWDRDGLLPLGWHAEHPAIRQGYSGPASPYWASKGFAGLLLPAEHPVWTAVEEPLELETRDVALALPAPGWLVSATRDDGIVRVVNHGGDHWAPEVLGLDDGVYGRLSYTGVTAPDDGLVAEAGPVDSSVVLLAADGRPSHRRPLERLWVDGRVAASRHRAHWLLGPAHDAWAEGSPAHVFEVGPWLTVASAVRGSVEVRVVRVDVDDDPAHGPAAHRTGRRAAVLPGPWRLRVGGHCVAGSEPPTWRGDAPGAAGGPAVAEVVGRPGPRARVVGLLGAWRPEVHRTSGANAMGAHAAVPLLVGTAHVEDGTVAAVAVVLTGGHLPLPPLPTVSVHSEASGRAATVTVRWPDGEHDRFPLDAPDPLHR
ncbi:MAG TPA: DUF2264 domain-containing protein, partial [Motilibacteraceae bacterium]|nr:DUF2264 domain-containing protein [Motilibacteraceae bacterium]